MVSDIPRMSVFGHCPYSVIFPYYFMYIVTEFRVYTVYYIVYNVHVYTVYTLYSVQCT